MTETYKFLAETVVDGDDIEATIIEDDDGLNFDFREEGQEEYIDGVHIPFEVLADMARQFMRGEDWTNIRARQKGRTE